MMEEEDLKQLKESIFIRLNQQQTLLNYLKDLKVKIKGDRLVILNYWNQAHQILLATLAQWKNILENPIVLMELDRKTLEEFYKYYKVFVEEFVEFDIFFAETIYSLVEEKLEKQKEETRKETGYVI